MLVSRALHVQLYISMSVDGIASFTPGRGELVHIRKPSQLHFTGFTMDLHWIYTGFTRLPPLSWTISMSMFTLIVVSNVVPNSQSAHEQAGGALLPLILRTPSPVILDKLIFIFGVSEL